jgi:hypothetical protein
MAHRDEIVGSVERPARLGESMAGRGRIFQTLPEVLT